MSEEVMYGEPVPEMLVVDVRGCQRCGQNHEAMEFRQLDNPVDEWDRWSMCPVKQQPVLLASQYVRD